MDHHTYRVLVSRRQAPGRHRRRTAIRLPGAYSPKSRHLEELGSSLPKSLTTRPLGKRSGRVSAEQQAL